jgi:2-polyprenyl-3-methyl-5-hydroxy-6-metoxy-1,4-benzoquinol methylase
MKTKEKQYQFLLSGKKEENLGLMSGQVWRDDPRRLVFLLRRYKFIAKMLSGLESILEVGCADAFGSRIVRQEVGSLLATDFDPIFIRDAKKRPQGKWPIQFKIHDMLKSPVRGSFQAVYSCDVLEHIPAKDEETFLKNMARSIRKDGVCIVGTPSLESQAYASPPSLEGHVNCKTAHELKELMKKFFENVFIFSMNDEIVHTGFYPMAHYLFALGCGVRSREKHE